MNPSTTRLPFIFAPLALVVLCFVSLTGFAQEPVSDSLPKNQIVATVPLGSEPSGMVVSPDSKSVYITNSTGPTAGIVQVLDTATNTITFTINVGSNSFPNTLAITPDGGTLYVADFFGPTVWVIDTATNQVTTTLNVNFPHGLAVNPDGTELYVCNTTGTVSVIDTATNQITSTIQIGHTKGHYPWDVVFTLDGSKAFIAARPNRASRGKKNHGYLAVVDTATQSVVASILLTTGRGILANIEVMDPNGRQLFYSQERAFKVINTSSDQVVRTIGQTFSHGPAAITPDGKFLYMVSAKDGTFNGVTTVDIASGRVVGKQIRPLSFPQVVAIAPNGKFAYVFALVASGGPWAVYVVDISPS